MRQLWVSFLKGFAVELYQCFSDLGVEQEQQHWVQCGVSVHCAEVC